MNNFLKSLFYAFLFTLWGMSLYFPFMYFYTLLTHQDLHKFLAGLPSVFVCSWFIFTFIFEMLHDRIDHMNREGQERLKKHNREMFGDDPPAEHDKPER